MCHKSNVKFEEKKKAKDKEDKDRNWNRATTEQGITAVNHKSKEERKVFPFRSHMVSTTGKEYILVAIPHPVIVFVNRSELALCFYTDIKIITWILRNNFWGCDIKI